jgi:hypothetical protein
MGEHALTAEAVRDGLVCALTPSGDLDLSETGGSLEPTALAVEQQPGPAAVAEGNADA